MFRGEIHLSVHVLEGLEMGFYNDNFKMSHRLFFIRIVKNLKILQVQFSSLSESTGTQLLQGLFLSELQVCVEGWALLHHHPDHMVRLWEHNPIAWVTYKWPESILHCFADWKLDHSGENSTLACIQITYCVFIWGEEEAKKCSESLHWLFLLSTCHNLESPRKRG